MKFIAIIPARYASSRFPGKPLVKIGSKTMVQRVYEQCGKTIENVFVATDDYRIEEEVKRFGGKTVMTSDQHKSGTDRCAEAIKKIRDIYNVDFDVVINVQGDEPFIQPKQIESLKKCFLDPQTQIATLIRPAISNDEIFNPNKPKVITDKNQMAMYFSRSPIPYLRGQNTQDWLSSMLYFMHIGMYAYKTKVLLKISKLEQTPLETAESLEQLRWIENGFKIKTEISDIEGISIDTPEDLQLLLKSDVYID